MKIEVKKEDIVEKETDSRGRVTLGKEYANQEVQLVVFSENEVITDEYLQVAKIASEIMENPDKTLEEISEDLREEN